MSTAEDALTPGQRLEKLRVDRGLSKRQLTFRLAKERGIPYETAKSSIYKWLRDAHDIGEENRAALGRIFGVPPGVFAGGLAIPGISVKLDAILARLGSLDDRLAKLETDFGAEGPALRDSLAAILEILRADPAQQQSTEDRPASPRRARK